MTSGLQIRQITKNEAEAAYSVQLSRPWWLAIAEVAGESPEGARGLRLAKSMQGAALLLILSQCVAKWLPGYEPSSIRGIDFLRQMPINKSAMLFFTRTCDRSAKCSVQSDRRFIIHVRFGLTCQMK